ncbi:hypothetical protein PIB30_029517 [Stylosanthes scabra]|uniref:J domain-containing protein n=2 Tax=Stylosanthes scabra TaxID=79078 RepID=A0ABU6TD73_9FABA|nr:hypothetical protein [Stylosanthes scabra]
MPNGDYFRSFHGDTEFNISYHNVNGASIEHRSKGKTHMAQMHAIPGSTRVYDETIRLHKTDPSFGAEKVKANHPRKTSRPRNFTSGEQTFFSDVNLHNGSHSAEMFITVSDISLRSIPSQVPPPSRPPPILDAKDNGRQVASEETLCDTSPVLFDVETDTNSSAAASAAATKEAMHKAEARLRSAKEMKERKKGAHESRVESSYDVKDSEMKTRLNRLDDETLQQTCDRRNSKLKISVSDERQKAGKATPETPDTMEGKRILNMCTEEHPNESRSSQESDRSAGDGTWKEETEFFELVGTVESQKKTQPTKPTSFLVQDTRTHGNRHKEIEAAPGVQDGYKKVIATEEYYQVEEYEQRYAAKEVYQSNKNILGPKASNEEHSHREQVKKEAVTEMFGQEENEKGVRVAPQNGKTEKKATEVDQSGSLKDVTKMQDKAHKQLHTKKLEVVDRQTSSEVQLGERLKENKKKLKAAEKQRQSVKVQKQSDKTKENEKGQSEAFAFGQTGDKEKLKDSVELEENEEQLKEEFEMEVDEIRPPEDFKQRQKQAYERDLNKREHNEAFDGCGDRNKLQEASDNEGIQNVLHQAPREEWNAGMLNEALRENEFGSPSTHTFDGEGSINVSKEEDNHTDGCENMGKDVIGMGEDNDSGSKDLDQIECIEVKSNMKIAKTTDEILEEETGKNLQAATSASIHEENVEEQKASQAVADKEIEKIRAEGKVQETKLEDPRVENRVPVEKVRAPEIILVDKQDLRPKSGKVDDGMMKADYERNTAAKGGTMQEAVNVQGTAQSTEIKEKILNEAPATVPMDAERMRRERESEKDRLRKIEEERDREREKDRMAVDRAMLEAEREREREKDRMAVDRATFEARDRVYAEACERAERAAFERATAEARQRALAEARERLEKACAEARDKSYADKAATEARLKAERAAVERATAEAQERAKEKLKVERAAFESRERLQRSVSDQYAVSSRNGGTQGCSPSDKQDMQFQNVSSSAGSRHPYSLYGASSFSERSETEGESARRCRSRLERHRRTAERAAKALAEKNMRDHLAQKEQAERTRLAETLDAEVKRWSSGKEGNLRALLSTLQYILGPDSGWQPIPLTEVITSAAVKKAYRKATLCVHPDKLQQRGASIQHKYICEKVFDLLKDAWNKFNSEER